MPMTLAALDIFHTAEAQCRPIFVDGDLTYRIETRIADDPPTRVPIEIAGVALRCAFGVGKPHHGIARAMVGEDCRQSIEFGLLRCKSQRELNVRGFLRIPYYLDAVELRQFGLERCRRIEYDDFRLRLQVEFLKYRGHGRRSF